MLFQPSFSCLLKFLITITLVLKFSKAIETELQILYCQDQDPPISCEGSYNPVCASYQRFCSQPPCPQYLEFPNSCAACQNPTVVSYETGSCSRMCPPPGTLVNCSNELIHPVCGYFTEDCTSIDCQTSFENSCAACLNSSVISYKPGKCPYEEGISCSTYIPSINCVEGSYISVCGTLNEDCNGFPCKMTFENPCSACIDSSAISFTPGPCEESEGSSEEALIGEESLDILIYCEDERPTSCSLDFNLVCAFFLIGCPDGVCSRTEVNGCTACQYPNVESYGYGRCEREKIPCDPSNRPTLCDNTPDAVCSFFINCANGICNQTDANSCTACMDSNVQYYVSGEC